MRYLNEKKNCGTECSFSACHRNNAVSRTHEMLENADCGMTDFGAGAIFEIWECEKVTGDPRNSIYIRGE